MSSDFDETLQGLIAEFTPAMQLLDGGQTEPLGGTAGLTTKVQSTVRLLVKLDATTNNLLQSDASLLAAWKSAVHVPRQHREQTTPSEGNPQRLKPEAPVRRVRRSPVDRGSDGE